MLAPWVHFTSLFSISRFGIESATASSDSSKVSSFWYPLEPKALLSILTKPRYRHFELPVSTPFVNISETVWGALWMLFTTRSNCCCLEPKNIPWLLVVAPSPSKIAVASDSVTLLPKQQSIQFNVEFAPTTAFFIVKLNVFWFNNCNVNYGNVQLLNQNTLNLPRQPLFLL